MASGIGRIHSVSHETVRCRANKFGPAMAANIRRKRGRTDSVWHLDETVVRINGQRMYMWRAVDKEGKVLDVLVQKRWNKTAALKLPRKLLKNQGAVPEAIVTDGLRSYPAAMKVLGCIDRHQPSRLRDNNCAENSHLLVRRRERTMQRFKPQGQAQRFVSTHSAIYNTFNIQRHSVSRNTMRLSRDRALRSGMLWARQVNMGSRSRALIRSDKGALTKPSQDSSQRTIEWSQIRQIYNVQRKLASLPRVLRLQDTCLKSQTPRIRMIR
nr:IS6 family transposase [Croceicoccus bisphenolivorans]